MDLAGFQFTVPLSNLKEDMGLVGDLYGWLLSVIQ